MATPFTYSIQGASGYSGYSGIQGTQGAQGSTGAQGAQGAIGPQGFTGLQGAQGNQGAQGAQGVAGGNGAQGATGTSGFSGAFAGSGTTNYVSKFTGASSLGNSAIYDSGLNTLGSPGVTVRAPLSAYFAYNVAPTLSAYTNGAFTINNANVELAFGTDSSSPYEAYIQARAIGAAWPLVLNPLGGNVGIGTTNPSTPLQVNAAGYVLNTNAYTLDMSIGAGGGGWARSFRVYNSSTPSTQTYYFGATSNYSYMSTGDPTVIDSTGYNASKILVLNNSGYVGIGTTTPNAALTVETGNKYIPAISISNFTGTTATSAIYMSWDNSGIIDWYAGMNNGSSTFQISRALSSPDFCINSGGAVGIGTGSPSYLLDVNGSARIVTSLGVGTTPSGTTGEIRATGNITAYYSDDRLKTKLGRIENALDKICSLEGFYYEANETAQALGYKPVREVGISAQATQKVLPEIVAPAPISDEYLTIRYERLAPLIIEAIKELREEIKALK